MTAASIPDTASARLRRGLLYLAAISLLGTAVELAAERHWTQPVMGLAWGALAVAAGAVALLAGSPSAKRVRLARVLSLVVMAVAVVGVGVHVYSNFDAGPLDQHYGAAWESLPLAARWWLAASKTVGPSPPLAPGVLAEVALCVLLATVQHPALGRQERQAGGGRTKVARRCP